MSSCDCDLEEDIVVSIFKEEQQKFRKFIDAAKVRFHPGRLLVPW